MRHWGQPACRQLQQSNRDRMEAQSELLYLYRSAYGTNLSQVNVRWFASIHYLLNYACGVTIKCDTKTLEITLYTEGETVTSQVLMTVFTSL